MQQVPLVTGPKHAPWLGAAVAILLHAGIATAMFTINPARFHAETPVEIEVAELPPPEVKPPDPEPPPPKIEPRRVVVRQVRAPRETPPPQPPPPSEAPPPKTEDPPPIFGGSLSSTVSGPSSVSIPLGDTLAVKPAPHPQSAKPSGDGTGDGVTPVADIYIRKYPEELFSVNSSDIYPPEARRMQIEGVLKFKIVIDEKGNVVRVKLLNHVGYGLDEAATQAMWKAKFKPAIATDGRPVPCNWTWAYRFYTE